MRTIKNTFFICMGTFLSHQIAFADDSAGMFGIQNGITGDDLRNGNLNMDSIPLIIFSIIEYLLGITMMVCVVALIYHAVRMQIASGITGDSSGVDKAKKGIYGSIFGFVLAMSSWFIMTKLVALLASTTGTP